MASLDDFKAIIEGSHVADPGPGGSLPWIELPAPWL
jgi:hypothetical protein